MIYTPKQRIFRRVGQHHLLILPKLASTSLKTLGDDIWEHHLTETEHLPIISFVRKPFERWVSGYIQYLVDIARYADGVFEFRPPPYVRCDIHTTPQYFQIRTCDYLLRFEDLNEYSKRASIYIPHCHKTSTHLGDPRAKAKKLLLRWLQENESFSKQLRLELQNDYLLRERCVPVQSLPKELFTL